MEDRIKALEALIATLQTLVLSLTDKVNTLAIEHVDTRQRVNRLTRKVWFK